jgi:inhibitor of cysteine peptidase
MYKYISFLLLFLFPFSLFAVSENTDLLTVDVKKLVAPEFSYRTFWSCQEFQDVMETILPKQNPWYRGGFMYDAIAPTAISAKAEWVSANIPHSETNIQVAGIDEADTVKTDGNYLYSYQSSQNGIIILDAKTLDTVKTIKLPSNYSNINFYVTKNKLILTATRYNNYNPYWYGWYDNSVKSVIALYDISDKSAIKLVRVVQVDGNLSDTRLADNGLMTVVVSSSYFLPPVYRSASTDTKQEYSYTSRTLIPRISDVQYNWAKRKTVNRLIGDCRNIASVLPSKETLSSYAFSPSLTSVLRFDTSIPAGAITTRTVLSEAGQIHVSWDSLYLTSNLWSPNSSSSSCPPNAKCVMPLIWNPGTSGTLVHRFSFEGVNTNYVYSKLIPWNPLNQYSMDEDINKNFRIVTTENGEKQSTRVSVLSSTGNILGTLSAIAPGENFQSSRFIGNRLYLVTFEQIDPLFVIDLSDAKNPKVLGELKIPGYSTYLHPYDEGRLIGIGYDTKQNQWGGTMNAGVKVDLYNVSDVKNPRQEATLTLGDVGSSSEVLTNPRAFVWYKEKNLLLMPVTLMTSAGNKENPYFAKSAFQGLLGISITPSSIAEKFRLSHIIKPETLATDWKNNCASYTYGYVPEYCKAGSSVETYFANNLWNYSSDFISRVLYVGENFYTIGDSKIQMQTFANPLNPLATKVFEGKKNPSSPIPLAVQ